MSLLVLDLPNSRRQETEADALGMKYSAKACFDPGEMPGVFTRLEALGEKNRNSALDLRFLRTHPPGVDRVQALNKLLPSAYNARAASDNCGDLGESLDLFFKDPLVARDGKPGVIRYQGWGVAGQRLARAS